MNYEQQFLKEYQKFSNPSSSYYRQGYQGLLDVLNASSPTINTIAGASMMQGGSYKGSHIAANDIVKRMQTQNAGTARKGFLDMYMSGQGLGMQALGGAAQAFQYEDSKPSFWEEVGGYALGGVTQALTGGAGGFLSGIFGGGLDKTTMKGGQTPQGWAASNNVTVGTKLPVGMKSTPVYKPFNY